MFFYLLCEHFCVWSIKDNAEVISKYWLCEFSDKLSSFFNHLLQRPNLQLASLADDLWEKGISISTVTNTFSTCLSVWVGRKKSTL